MDTLSRFAIRITKSFLLTCCSLLILGTPLQALAVGERTYLVEADDPGAFPLVGAAEVAAIWVSQEDDTGLMHAARMFREDVARVTGKFPELLNGPLPQAKNLVVVGTLGGCPEIDWLLRKGKLNTTGINGRWEAAVTQVIEFPFDGVDRALVIAGSDKRGAMFGLLNLSKQIGVSPWHWWADVPSAHRDALYLSSERQVLAEPKVKYRGIFLNDEAPALANWAQEKFGGCNAKFYEHVYQLLLRLRGNYLWPAMWGRSIYDDDPRSPELANEYGIVIGMSHHEPMMRAHVEWQRYGEGPWNYEKNQDRLRAFWREGIRRMGDNESIVTVGMRGDGDEPMSEDANIALLQRIVADQRQILSEELGKPIDQQPQLWALYKEVQEYYDRGMRVPEDVTLLLCDDNWGNLRKLPHPSDAPHPGGYGIYYHFDYVGGPRNYKWINTNPLPRIWEQMNLAYRHGVQHIWLVNVGDLKPMELPIEFFLDLAWDPDKWPAERLAEYQQLWAQREFGTEHAEEIAQLVAGYAKFNSRRKPELLDAETYSLVNYREAERVVDEYRQLEKRAQVVRDKLPAEYHDAFFQLVLHPVAASANLHDLYFTVAKNRLYAEQGRALTNSLAQRARQLYAQDRQLTDRYHNLNNKKWNHMMSQNHIGYTYWQEPPHQSMPEVREIELPANAQLGVALEGSSSWWPAAKEPANLPELVPGGEERLLEIFNLGQQPFTFTVKSSASWLKATPSHGQIDKQTRVELAVDWQAAPIGQQDASLVIESSTGESVTVQVKINHYDLVGVAEGTYLEQDGYVSIPADQFAKSSAGQQTQWQLVPDLGKTGSAVMPVPVTAARSEPKTGGCVEYPVLLQSGGEVTVRVYVSPTIDYYSRDGLHYAVSFDQEPPQTVALHQQDASHLWNTHVAENINVSSSRHTLERAGEHVLKLWVVDPGVVVQKLVVETGQVRPSYMGPPPSPQASGN